MSVRYSILASAVGFLGGILYKERSSLKSTNVYAANPFLPTPLTPEPMVIDEPSDRIINSMVYGFPSLDNISCRKSYIISFDRRNRVPNWVFEHLTPELIQYNESVSRTKTDFFEDYSIHPYFRPTNKDYLHSGYDRGHMAASANHRSSQDLLNDTFVLSNTAPQVGKGFNRDAWNYLEKHVRGRVKKYKNFYVVTGPLYLPRIDSSGKKIVQYEVIGANHVAVPTHFFKVLVGERADGRHDMESFVMPNEPIAENIPLKAFLVPRDVIERASGLLLFEKLPDSQFYRINGHRQNKSLP